VVIAQVEGDKFELAFDGSLILAMGGAPVV
jgi:hypothetical protein